MLLERLELSIFRYLLFISSMNYHKTDAVTNLATEACTIAWIVLLGVSSYIIYSNKSLNQITTILLKISNFMN